MRPHISLNVKDVERSVKFYKSLFGIDPQKQTGNYAKFDLQKPALNFSMQSSHEPSRVSHLGIEVTSPEELKDWETRPEKAGLLGVPEKQSTCCFARQDKIWFKDPDGNAWEIFYVFEQLPVTQSGEKSSCCA